MFGQPHSILSCPLGSLALGTYVNQFAQVAGSLGVGPGPVIAFDVKGVQGGVEALLNDLGSCLSRRRAFTLTDPAPERGEGQCGERDDLIRTAGRDEPIGAATITTWVREAFRRAGIKYGAQGDGLTLHSGRHTFASWLAQDGVSLTVVARLLGDTTQVVEQVYAHLVPDTFRGAIDRIEARVTG